MPDKFNYVKRGYDPAAVDECIDSLESVIKSYKEKDTAIKNAILNAQIAADNIIQNAQNHSYEIKENSVNQIKSISDSIVQQKEMLDEFQHTYNEQIEKYLTKINAQDFAAINQKIVNLEKFLQKYADEVSSENPENKGK